ncbi:MAG: hypothetical protein MNSN_09660 [Minisyncoccus archaeiphilus]|uniref:hypothetical protein n=1 Tax=Minisyncoccus archaeiphilus TaxID=3238481 RepID=UPI0009C81973|nr:MAG: hypothetical protein BWY21_01260 [Parcubacteria group bacterium ADurb.Bin216]GMX59947.1 MAG: hypothetical protein MNSN_09660 [Candidatus Parcubacteria bacterium]
MPIALAYFYWYYFERTKDIIRITKGYVRYWAFFFSFKQTLRSLFAPWKMMDMPQKGSLMKEIFETAFNNIFSRVMGLMMRTFLIGFFLAFEVATIAIGISFLVIWILMPIILIYIIIYSFTRINV